MEFRRPGKSKVESQLCHMTGWDSETEVKRRKEKLSDPRHMVDSREEVV